MAGGRQPTSLILVKGKKHLTKAEIAERLAKEVGPCTDNIEAPSWLTAKQKSRFNELALQLEKINILGETDTDTLARYVVASSEYSETLADLRKVKKEKPPSSAGARELSNWTEGLEVLDKRLERYFKQSQALARDLGLTISSRCKLQVPQPAEQPKNKFDKFAKAAEE